MLITFNQSVECLKVKQNNATIMLLNTRSMQCRFHANTSIFVEIDTKKIKNILLDGLCNSFSDGIGPALRNSVHKNNF